MDEFSARTVDEAVRQAETRFGVSRSELTIEVITPGRSGVFGIGAENARIRAGLKPAAATPPAPTHVAEPEPEQLPEPELAIETAPVEPEHPAHAEEPETTPPAQASAGSSTDTLPEDAADVLRNLLHAMGFEVEVQVRSRENPVMVAITGENLGVLIGRRGDNLSALQFMVNLILSKNRRQWPRVVVDVENYRARREESLTALAERIAYRVRRNGRPFTLEAMPAGDRRVIHLSLRDRQDIETYSIGEGSSRRVVVAPRRSGDRQPEHDSYR